MYCEHEESDVKEQVDLLCVLQFTENTTKDCENSLNGDLGTKHEESFVPVKIENVEKDNRSNDHFSNDSSTEFYIKEEEVDIKAENDQRMQMRESNQLDDSDVTNNGFLKKMSSFKKESEADTTGFANTSLQDNTQTPPHLFNSHECIYPTHEGKFKCKECPYQGKKLTNLRKHMMVHSDKNHLSCDQCTYSTHAKDYLRRHKRNTHMDRPKIVLQCNQCNFCTKSASSLSVHKKTHDPTKHKFMCEQCEYSTYYRARLREHLKTHMELEETVLYYCATCDFKSKYKSSLHYHLKGRSKEKDGADLRVMLHCAHCDYRTKNKSSLCLHRKTHDPTICKYKCEQCEYATYRRSRLGEHLKTHMELGETTAFYCETCDFKSKYKKSLTDHLKRCLKNDGNKN